VIPQTRVYNPRIIESRSQQRGNLGHVDKRRVRLVQVSAKVLERRPLELAVPLSRALRL